MTPLSGNEIGLDGARHDVTKCDSHAMPMPEHGGWSTVSRSTRTRRKARADLRNRSRIDRSAAGDHGCPSTPLPACMPADDAALLPSGLADGVVVEPIGGTDPRCSTNCAGRNGRRCPPIGHPSRERSTETRSAEVLLLHVGEHVGDHLRRESDVVAEDRDDIHGSRIGAGRQ